mmetsp:Transcript_4198/g.6219  ORF Transcript_4198/g.6219 Transcript_4198/m.6219 type:complete len:576 (+) Transcript_4198:40-1767(+)
MSSSEDGPISSVRGKKKKDNIEDELFEEDEDATSSSSEEEKNEDEMSESEISESDGYGPDYMGKGADRKRVLDMPERDREELIYDRMQERKQRRERKAAARRRREKGNKRGVPKRSNRGMTAHSRLQKERQQWALEQIKKKKKRVARKPEDDEDYEEEQDDEVDKDVEDLGEEEDFEEEEEEEDKKPWTTETPISLQALKKCMLRRDALERLTQEGYFEDYARGMFTRVGVGEHRGEKVYKCCRIVSIEDGRRPYRLHNNSQTKKEIRVAMGKIEKSFPITYFSNQSITDKEFQKWKKFMESSGLFDEIPCCEELYEMRAKAERLRKNYTYSKDTIDRLVKEKAEMGFVLNLTKERERLESELLRIPPDSKERKMIEKRLKDIESRQRREEKEYKHSQAAALHQINKRQLQFNKQRRKKIQQLRKRQKKDETEDAADLDPFKRRHTVSTGMVISVGPSVKKVKKKSQEKKETKKEKVKKTVSMIDQLLLDNEKTVERTSAQVQAMKDAIETDPSWLKLRNLYKNFDLNIDVNSTYIEPKQPKLYPVERPDVESILSVQEYQQQMQIIEEEDDWAG